MMNSKIWFYQARKGLVRTFFEFFSSYGFQLVFFFFISLSLSLSLIYCLGVIVLRWLLVLVLVLLLILMLVFLLFEERGQCLKEHPTLALLYLSHVFVLQGGTLRLAPLADPRAYAHEHGERADGHEDPWCGGRVKLSTRVHEEACQMTRLGPTAQCTETHRLCGHIALRLGAIEQVVHLVAVPMRIDADGFVAEIGVHLKGGRALEVGLVVALPLGHDEAGAKKQEGQGNPSEEESKW